MVNIEQIMAMVDESIKQDAIEKGVMSIATLLSGLEQFAEGDLVITDEGYSLGDCDSYRGYYERLAFCPTTEACTVGNLRAMLHAANGKTYIGYKGGDFLMNENTLLHIAPYGDCGPMIVGITRANDTTALILTAEDEF